MAQLNYHHLRYFWAIAHAGSLTKAAEQLHLSQSAVSVQLAKLEAQLGHPLFDRLGRSLVLTEAGRIALDYADTMFQAGDELLSTLRSQPAMNRPVLKVGALTTLSRNFQMEFLRPLMGRADISVVVLDDGPDVNVDGLPKKSWAEIVLDDLTDTGNVRVERVPTRQEAEALVQKFVGRWRVLVIR